MPSGTRPRNGVLNGVLEIGGSGDRMLRGCDLNASDTNREQFVNFLLETATGTASISLNAQSWIS